MKTRKALSPMEIQAAFLVAQGCKEREIYTSCGKTRGWLQTLKRRDDFKAEVEKNKLQNQEELSASSPQINFVAETYQDSETLLKEIIDRTFESEFSDNYIDHKKHLQSITEAEIIYRFLGEKFLDLAEQITTILLKKLELIDPESVRVSRVTSILNTMSRISVNSSEMINRSFGLGNLFDSKEWMQFLKQDETDENIPHQSP